MFSLIICIHPKPHKTLTDVVDRMYWSRSPTPKAIML